MSNKVKFGWVVPSQAATINDGDLFVDQVFASMDQLQDGFDSI